MKNSILIAALLLVASPKLLAQQPFWTKLGSPFAADFRTIFRDSTGNIFAGAADYGIFKSSDDGASWERKGEDGVTVSAFIKLTNGDLLAGAIEGFFRSTDDGETWDWNGIDEDVRCLALTPSGVIIAGTTSTGVLRSTDNGSTWNPSNQGLPSDYFLSSVVLPSGTVYLGSYTQGLFVSTNDGSDWSSVPTVTGSIRSLSISSIGTLLAGSEGQIFRSTDLGTTWTAVDVGENSALIRSILVAGTGTIIVGTVDDGVYRSTNDGVTWIESSMGLASRTIRGLTLNSAGNVISAPDWSALHVSTDDGESWSAISGFEGNTRTYILKVHANGYLFGATAESGLCRSTDGGTTWFPLSPVFYEKLITALNIAPNGDIFAGIFQEGVIRSTDLGVTWQQTGLSTGNIESLTSTHSNHLFAGTIGDGIYTSSDDGISWVNYPISSSNFQCFAFAVGNSGQVFAGTLDGVFRFDSTSDSWQLVNTGIAHLDIRALATYSGNIVYAGSTVGGVYRSTNDGESWEQIGLNLYSTRDMVVDKSGILYVGAGSNITPTVDWSTFRFSPAGSSFERITSGLGRDSVTNSIDISPANYLFAATNGGIFRSTDSIVTSSPEDIFQPNTFSLSQNYPNPFNPSTDINYQLAISNFVSLKVYNLLGQEVRTPVNEKMEAGEHRVTFNAEGLPSGVYIYRIQAGEYSASRKMVIIK